MNESLKIALAAGLGVLVGAAGLARAGDAPAAAPAVQQAPGACSQWTVVTWSAAQLQQLGKDAFKRTAPEGWEPFAAFQSVANGNQMYSFRRCGPP